jgi:hypothetical protein
LEAVCSPGSAVSSAPLATALDREIWSNRIGLDYESARSCDTLYGTADEGRRAAGRVSPKRGRLARVVLSSAGSGRAARTCVRGECVMAWWYAIHFSRPCESGRAEGLVFPPRQWLGRGHFFSYPTRSPAWRRLASAQWPSRFAPRAYVSSYPPKAALPSRSCAAVRVFGPSRHPMGAGVRLLCSPSAGRPPGATGAGNARERLASVAAGARRLSRRTESLPREIRRGSPRSERALPVLGTPNRMCSGHVRLDRVSSRSRLT